MKIGFIGTGVLEALRGKVVGGAEKQQALIIEGLTKKGADVLVFEYYLDKPTVEKGINFYPAWDKRNTSFIRNFKQLSRQVKNNNIDAVYTRGTQLYVAFLFLYLKITNSKIRLFWGIANDHDLKGSYNKIGVKRAKTLYGKFNKGVLKNFCSFLLFHFCDVVICQTLEQMEMGKSKWVFRKKRREMITNIFIDHSEIVNNELELKEVDAIWIGRINGVKGERYLLKLAQEIPKIKILCLGKISDSFKSSRLYHDIVRQENISLLGYIPYENIYRHISKADFVLSTSPVEGFSNVFLEGWNQSKPVISLNVDPNKSLSEGECGFCANGSYQEFKIHINKILKDKSYMAYHGKKGKERLMKDHTSELISQKYFNLFNGSN